MLCFHSFSIFVIIFSSSFFFFFFFFWLLKPKSRLPRMMLSFYPIAKKCGAYTHTDQGERAKARAEKKNNLLILQASKLTLAPRLWKSLMRHYFICKRSSFILIIVTFNGINQFQVKWFEDLSDFSLIQTNLLRLAFEWIRRLMALFIGFCFIVSLLFFFLGFFFLLSRFFSLLLWLRLF